MHLITFHLVVPLFRFIIDLIIGVMVGSGSFGSSISDWTFTGVLTHVYLFKTDIFNGVVVLVAALWPQVPVFFWLALTP